MDRLILSIPHIASMLLALKAICDGRSLHDMVFRAFAGSLGKNIICSVG